MGHNAIELTIGRFLFGAALEPEPVVLVRIDGIDLFEAVEATRNLPEPDWEDDCDDDGVPGLSPDLLTPPSLHWLGNPDPRWSESGRAVVLDCGCGQWECGGVLARIEVRPDVITWSDFRGPRDGDPIPVGPFVFDREQYEAALASLASSR